MKSEDNQEWLKYEESQEWILLTIYSFRKPLTECYAMPIFNDHQLERVIKIIESYVYPNVTDAEKWIMSQTTNINENLPDGIPPLRPFIYNSYADDVRGWVRAKKLPETIDYDQVISQLYVNDTRFQQAIIDKLKNKDIFKPQEFVRLCSNIRICLDMKMHNVGPLTPNEKSIVMELARCGMITYGIDSFSQRQLAEWVDVQRYKIKMEYEESLNKALGYEKSLNKDQKD